MRLLISRSMRNYSTNSDPRCVCSLIINRAITLIKKKKVYSLKFHAVESGLKYFTKLQPSFIARNRNFNYKKELIDYANFMYPKYTPGQVTNRLMTNEVENKFRKKKIHSDKILLVNLNLLKLNIHRKNCYLNLSLAMLAMDIIEFNHCHEKKILDNEKYRKMIIEKFKNNICTTQSDYPCACQPFVSTDSADIIFKTYIDSQIVNN